MTTISVQFSDSTEKTIIGYASCAQSPSTWPYQGEIDTDDARWSAYYNAQDASLIRPYLPAPTA